MFHFAAVVLIVTAIDATPRGAAEYPGGEIGIVLETNRAQGVPHEPEVATEAAQATPAAPVSEPTLVAAPVDAASETAAANAASPATTPSHSQKSGNYGPSNDGQTTVRLFGVEGRGTKFVYVFDRSTSMEGPPLATAKRQLIESLESLQSIHQFHVIFFNQRIRHFDLSGGGRRIAFATDRNKKMAARFVGGITADGGTDRFPALRAAVALRPDVIFFLTDADDPMARGELEEIAQLNERVGVTITTIEFGRGPARRSKNFLVELAQMTGGQYGYVDTLSLPR